MDLQLSKMFDAMYSKLDSLSGDAADRLDFGAIQLDPEGTVLTYNRFESKLVGLDAKRVIGKNFFRDVAPCTDVQEFHGAFKRGMAEKNLYTKFRFQFLFKHRDPMNVFIAIQYSSKSNTAWVFVHPVGPSS